MARPRPVPGLPVSSRAPRWKMASRCCLRNALAVVLDQDVDHLAVRLDRDEHAAAAIFRGILDEVADHLVEVLPLDADLRAADRRRCRR